MFLITNRAIRSDKKGFDQLDDIPNPLGPTELRLVEVTKKRRGYSVQVLDDEITAGQRNEIGLSTPKRIPSERNQKVFASHYVAYKIAKSISEKQRNLLFFVHGFNNDPESVVERAMAFEKEFDVEVIAFSWPANGGGLRGAASYKSDKRDARASIGALDACFGKLRRYLNLFNQKQIEKFQKEAKRAFPNNSEKQNDYVSKKAEQLCPFTVNMVAHSMGNYLFKNTLLSSVYHGRDLLFDNVVLVAADTNNRNHAIWVDKIRCRNRIYICINEKDSALRISRMKAGEQQLARLGHYTNKLNSDSAVYVDFTDADEVGRSHAYFEGDCLENKNIKEFFKTAFNGGTAEKGLGFSVSRNLYCIDK